MSLIKKILIVIVLILFIYIILRLLKSRALLQREIVSENFSLSGTADKTEIDKLISKNHVKLQSSSNAKLPLKEYCIKASYNTALTGNYVNLDMIKYVIGRGCRFLDFEVFYVGKTKTDDKGNAVTIYTAEVAYSTDNTFTTINSENSILLEKVLTTIITNAFSQSCTNRDDPMFINLRIKSNKKDAYKAIATALDSTIKPKLYTDSKTENDEIIAKQVTKLTPLSDIMGKIILCVDKTIDRNYRTYTPCDDNNKTCYDLINYINMETGGEDLNLLRYSEVMEQCITPININNDNITTDVKTIKYVIPNTKNDNSQNPNISDFVLKYSSQIPAFRFYKNDDQLNKYEEFFDDNGSAFVSLAVAIPYFKRLLD